MLIEKRPIQRPRRYLPRFEGPVQGYVLNFLRANYWRVKGSMEFQDCTQEAYELFLRLERKWPVLDSPKHFMALFKTSWVRHFHDLSNDDTDLRSMLLASQLGGSFDDDNQYQDLINSIPGELDCDGELKRLLDQSPPDVRSALAFFLVAPQEVVDAAFAAWRGAKRKKEGGNKMLCQLLGLPEGHDIIGRISSHFGNA